MAGIGLLLGDMVDGRCENYPALAYVLLYVCGDMPNRVPCRRPCAVELMSVPTTVLTNERAGKASGMPVPDVNVIPSGATCELKA
jgi:hypothetical protein